LIDLRIDISLRILTWKSLKIFTSGNAFFSKNMVVVLIRQGYYFNCPFLIGYPKSTLAGKIFTCHFFRKELLNRCAAMQHHIEDLS